METTNRRQHYRFKFGCLSQPKAELICVSGGANTVTMLGSLTDLSMGGAAIRLEEIIPPPWWGKDWFVRFSLAENKGSRNTLAILCRLTHRTPTRQGHIHGLQFLATETASHEVERRFLWQFLLDKQRGCLAVSAV